MELTVGEVLFVLPYLASLVLSVGLLLFGIQRSHIPVALPLAAYALNQAAWTAGFLLKSFAPDLETKILWDNLLFVPFLLLPFMMLVTSRAFVGKKVLPLAPGYWILLAVIVGMLLLVLGDDRRWVHPDARLVPGFPRGELAYSFTPLVYGMSLMVYAVSLVVFARIGNHTWRVSGRMKKQGIFLLVGLLVPLVAGLFTLAGVTIGPHRDIAPLSFGLGDLIIVWGVYRYRILDLLPMAYEAAFRSIEDPVAVTDLDSVILAHNPAYAVLVCAPGTTVVGRLFPFPGTTDLVADFSRYDLRESPVLGSGGKKVGTLYLFRDVSRLQKAQAEKVEVLLLRNQTLMELSLEGIHILDDQGNVVEANPAFCRMLGYTHDELLGMNVADWDTQWTKDQLLKNIGEMVGNPARFETRHRRKDGTLLEVEVFGVGIQGAGHRYLYASARDMTDRKRIEAEAEKNQRLDSLGVLAGGIAHDFNNILTGMNGQIEMALLHLKAGRQEKAVTWLMNALSAQDRGKSLTRQLLTFSKGGAPVRAPTALGPRIQEWVDFALIGAGIEASITIEPELWTCDCDVHQISQVVHNLVINARQASASGGRLSVHLANRQLDGPFVTIAVSDQGTGMVPETMQKIFDPFFTTKPDGTGLGLSVSFSIAKKHSGWIEVSSQWGVGSTFTLYLPATPDRPDALDPISRQ